MSFAAKLTENAPMLIFPPLTGVLFMFKLIDFIHVFWYNINRNLRIVTEWGARQPG